VIDRHTEGPPTVFGCALNYITMRLLGVDAHDKDLVSAKNMLRSLGNYCFLWTLMCFTADLVTLFLCMCGERNQPIIVTVCVQ